VKVIGIPLLVISVLVIAQLAAAEQGQGPVVPKEITSNCQSCHGARGDSPAGDVPRLNGQQSAYLVQRMKDFRDPTREDPHATTIMWRVMSNVSDASFTPIAAYYAEQKPTRAAPKSTRAIEGRKIFMMGAADIPACQSCHGVDAGGRGAIPRLAGQHAAYLKNQLERLSLAMRESDIMHPTLRSMSEAQMDAIVAYLARD